MSLGLASSQAFAQAALTPLEQQCFDAVQGQVAWNVQGNRTWNPNNVRRLCRGTTDPAATIACFAAKIQVNAPWEQAIDACNGGAQPPDAVAAARNADAAAGITGRTATRIVFGPSDGPKRGDYRLIRPGQWVETGADGSARFQFQETGRDDWSVYLLDSSRGVKIQLDLYTRQVKYDDGRSPQRALYHVQSAAQAGVPIVDPNAAQRPMPASMQPPLTDRLDPACMASAPWAVNVREVDLQLYGCRASNLEPQPNAAGWRHFDNPQGGYLETHVVSVDAAAGVIVFEVVYSGGGSGAFKSRITGHPMQGVLKAGTFKVDY